MSGETQTPRYKIDGWDCIMFAMYLVIMQLSVFEVSKSLIFSAALIVIGASFFGLRLYIIFVAIPRRDAKATHPNTARE